MHLAFKDADLAGDFFSKAIKWRTRGRFSHVEVWLSGPINAARCFSSRVPNGTGHVVIDLTEQRRDQTGKMCNLWTCVKVPCTPEQEIFVRWFIKGMGYKRYDYPAILGFVLNRRRIHDKARITCSECGCLILQKCFGLFLKDSTGHEIFPWTVSPWTLFLYCRTIV